MTAVLVVRDPDQERRTRAVASARASLDAAGLVPGSLERGDVAVAWGAPPSAPVDRATGPTWDVLLLGDLLAEGTASRCDAATYGRRWGVDGIPEPFDGFHLALVVGDGGAVTVDVDLLGLLPLEHTTAGEVFLAATAIALLRAHESFRPRIDRQALATILLADAPATGTTSIDGVRRLPPGHVLRSTPAGTTEVPTFAVPVSATHHDLPVAAAARLLDEELRDACTRHTTGDGRLGLLLSGGLDSRLLAGVLLAQQVPFRAVTFGLPTDSEWRFAHRVAERIGIPHDRVPDDGTADGFDRWVQWDAVTSTPFLEPFDLGDRFDRVVSGFTMDAVAGSHIDWCHDPVTGEVGFPAFLTCLNRGGIAIDDLRRLLRPEVFGDAVEGAIAAVRADYETGGEGDLVRTWRYDLAHRQRFWVGARVPRQAFGAWPVLPHVDRRVLEVAGGLPMALLANRQVEIELCRTRYPQLARIPLDTADVDAAFLTPRLPDMVAQAARRRVRWARERVGVGGRETRYFSRIFDIRGEQWQEVRRRAETGRTAAYELFVPEVLDELVPPAGQEWDRPSAYYDSNGAKMLLGVQVLLEGGVVA